MRKQTALLLSSLVLFSAVSMQPANAFSWKFWQKKEKPVVEAPVKKEIVPVKSEEHAVEKKDIPAVKTPEKPAAAPVVKPVVKPATPAVKPAVVPAKPACKCGKPNCNCAKPAVKAPVKK